ncbi:MAG: diguanylate cyclase [Gammaproteobacteria bacterium]|nr:diguanylate cyclase [Gammaproteobacteria bacterium]
MLAIAYWFGVLGTVTFAVLYGLHAWARYRAESRARLALMTAMIAAATREGLNGQASRMAFLAEQLGPIRQLRHRHRVSRLFWQYERVSPDITSVALMTPTDRVVAATAKVARHFMRVWRRNPQLQEDLQRSMRTPGVSVQRPLYDPQTRHWLVYVGYTVWRRTGGPRYMILETMDFRAFGHVFVHLPLIPGLAVGLLRGDFYIEAREPIPRDNLRDLMVRPQSGILVRTLIAYPDRRAGFFEGLVSADDQYRFGAYERVRGYPLVAFVDMPRRQELLGWWRGQVEIPLGFLLVALLFSAVAYHRIQVLTRRWEREKERQKNMLRNLAVHDPLTGLLNRMSLTALLKRAIERARRYERLVAVGFLDVNDFKLINDRHGHTVGDAVLKELAARLKGAMRSTDWVVRLGGDEFVLVMEGLQAIEDLGAVIDHVHAVITKPFVVNDIALQVQVSLGITIYPADDADADGLLRHADQAMYAAKTQRGAKWVQIYDPHRPRFGGAEGG